MKPGDVWMPLVIGDYLGGTRHLTTVQHGAYLLLLMASWRIGALPDDDRQLATMAGLSLKAWQPMSATIRAFFSVAEGGGLVPMETYQPKAQHRRELDVSPSAWAALRATVIERDGMCVYCGADDRPLECDHVIPVAAGGLSVISNLAAACRPCNRSKGAKPVGEWLA